MEESGEHFQVASLGTGEIASIAIITALTLIYTFDPKVDVHGVSEMIGDVLAAGLEFKDVQSVESSLEDIFVSLVRAPK